MARYRKKPVVVEAVELRWYNWSEICEFANVGKLDEGRPEGTYVREDGTPTKTATERLGLHIPTLEGTMLAVEGDWIIKGVQGELYPCKPDIFEATYDRVSLIDT